MRHFLNLRLFVIVLAMLGAFAGTPAAGQSQEAQAYSQDELDQLLAPIALYPDDLLTQILVASTYPLEVVEAARFVETNPGLQGAALDDAVAKRNWDPSVQSLTAFPQVLAMMNDKLEWTERLGNAFLADERRVMDTVQTLRRRAEAAGYLASTPQQSVVEENQAIVVAPAQPDVVYVPVYDPLIVYGPWWAPGYPPWFWYPPPVYGYPVYITGIAFGIGWAVHHDHWGWGHADWHGHQVVLNGGHSRFWSDRPNRPAPAAGQVWQHSPYHRRGVPYADALTRARFQPVSPGAVRERQNYRGYALPAAPSGPAGSAAPTGSPSRTQAPGAAMPPRAFAPPAASERARAPATAPQAAAPIVRQAPVPPYNPPRASSPSIFDPGASRAQAQMNAQRGMQSLRSVPAPAVPAIRAPSAPAPVMRAPSAPAPVTHAPSPPARSAPTPPAPPARGR